MSFRFRAWQNEALILAKNKYNNNSKDKLFMVTAFPGAGKTCMALTFLDWAMKQNSANFLLILVPTIELRRRWGQDAEIKWGMKTQWDQNVSIDTNINRVHLTSNYKGIVATYQGFATLCSTPKKSSVLQNFFKDKNVLMVLDECHHLSESNTWGKSLKNIFKYRSPIFSLSLSGTAFRTDNTLIPF